MITKKKSGPRRVLSVLLTLVMTMMMVLSGNMASFASSDVNTDSDTESCDGRYTFTGDGDWYGYKSYLNEDYDAEIYISGRMYMVTLPEDGRLQVEVSVDRETFLEVRVNHYENDYINEQIWLVGNALQPETLNETSDMLAAGTHRVVFDYRRWGSDVVPYWPPGKKEFYHKVTFKSLSADEKAAFSVMKAAKKLSEEVKYDPTTILNYEPTVTDLRASYEKLTDKQKAYVSSSALSTIKEYESYIDSAKKAAEEAKKEQEEIPSDTPSDTPSVIPSDTPSDMPSDTPGTDNAGNNPTDNPGTDNPSDKPADNPKPTVNPVNQKGADGTALGEGASVQAAESAIAGMTSDNDLPGAVFNKLQLKSSKQSNTMISLSWKTVPGAASYVIYGNKCGKNNKMQRLAISAGKSMQFTEVLGEKLKKGTYYKFMIVALDRNNNVVSSSKIIHVATKGGKVGNVGKVTTKAKKNKVSIKKGKTFKLAGKQKPAVKKLKVKKHRAVIYESTDPEIATVSKKGVIKGKKKGTCYIYAYAQNGVFAKIKVTVK